MFSYSAQLETSGLLWGVTMSQVHGLWTALHMGSSCSRTFQAPSTSQRCGVGEGLVSSILAWKLLFPSSWRSACRPVEMLFFSTPLSELGVRLTVVLRGGPEPAALLYHHHDSALNTQALTHRHTHTQRHESERATLGAVIIASVTLCRWFWKTPESTSKHSSHFCVMSAHRYKMRGIPLVKTGARLIRELSLERDYANK